MTGTPIRRCLACRRRAPKSALVRLVAAGGTITVDPAARQPGRGAYVCTGGTCLERALDKEGSALVRALRRSRGQVTVDEAEIRRQWMQAARIADRRPAAAASRSTE